MGKKVKRPPADPEPDAVLHPPTLWHELVSQELASERARADDLWPVFCQLFGRKREIAWRITRCLVSPYAQGRLPMSASVTAEYLQDLESEVRAEVRFSRVNDRFTTWRLRWPAHAEPSPSEDLYRIPGFKNRKSRPGLLETCKQTELTGLVCHQGNPLVQHLLEMLVAFSRSQDHSTSELGEAEKLDLDAAKVSFHGSRTCAKHTYKYVVRLLFSIGEPLFHVPDPRFSLGVPSHGLGVDIIPGSEPVRLPLPGCGDTKPWAQAHPWLREDGNVVEQPPWVHVCQELDCLRAINGTLESCTVETTFTVWRYRSSNGNAMLCYLFICPQEPSLKKDGWRSEPAIDAASWVVHPLRHCEWAWPEDSSDLEGFETRSMCCPDIPLVLKIVEELAKTNSELRRQLGGMHVTDYRSFLLKALDYLAD